MATKPCGFTALRCILTALNVFYIAVGLFLIGLIIIAKTLAYYTTVSGILVGIAVCATVLLFVAILGLVGTIKHHQVILFFYMVILGLTGMVLFAVSVAALTLPEDLEKSFFRSTWEGLSNHDKQVLQEDLDCCGFDSEWRNYTTQNETNACSTLSHPPCDTSKLRKTHKCCHNHVEINITTALDANNCTVDIDLTCPDCHSCYTAWEESVASGIWVAGSFGLFFSLTQVIGIVLTFRYRNQKDPEANPSAFL